MWKQSFSSLPFQWEYNPFQGEEVVETSHKCRILIIYFGCAGSSTLCMGSVVAVCGLSWCVWDLHYSTRDWTQGPLHWECGVLSIGSPGMSQGSHFKSKPSTGLRFSCHHTGIKIYIMVYWVFLVAQMIRNLPAMREPWIQSLGREDPLEKGMATHSSILAWRIPWTVEISGLQSMKLQKVRHNWAKLTPSSPAPTPVEQPQSPVIIHLSKLWLPLLLWSQGFHWLSLQA